MKIMVERRLLADGSVREFLNGTNFNRYKKLHVVAALSFEVLHFKAFLEKYLEGGDDGILYENGII